MNSNLPQETASPVTEENVYTGVYRLLIAGMIASNAFFAVALALALLHPQQVPLTSRWVRQQYSWAAIVHGLASGNPMTFSMLGTLLLILTPVARVITSIYAFFVDHDFTYVAVTSFVLLIMVITVILGLLGLQ